MYIVLFENAKHGCGMELDPKTTFSQPKWYPPFISSSYIYYLPFYYSASACNYSRCRVSIALTRLYV